MKLIWNQAVGMYADDTGNLMFSREKGLAILSLNQQQQSSTPVAESADMIFYNGQYIRVFQNPQDPVIAAYAGQTIATPKAKTPASYTGKGAYYIPKSSAQTPQAVGGQVIQVAWAIIFIVLLILVLVATAWFAIWQAHSPTTINNTVNCSTDYSCDRATITGGGVVPAGGSTGLPGIGDIITYAVIAGVVIGLGYIGYRAYASAKAKTPIRQVVREVAEIPGAAARGLYRGFVPAKPQPAAAAPPIQSPAGGYTVREAAA